MVSIIPLLKAMVQRDCSDLHLRAGSPPIFRLNGGLVRAQMAPLTPRDLDHFTTEIMQERQQELFRAQCELDFAASIPGVGRFRVNAFSQRGSTAFAIRCTKLRIPPFETLNMPDVLLDIAMRNRGLILVTGTTGSGKSTLLASMLNHVNQHKAANIITIEDPIEYLFSDVKSTVAQREVGMDSESFHNALRASFRQDPDIILIGEIRDQITMETALSAADTGHLVVSTLHTMDCVETISRVISFFPPHQHEQIRLVLASVLVAIVCIRLLPTVDGSGRVPATEVLVNNATIAEYLLDRDKAHLILPAVREGLTQYGSRSFDQSLLMLYKENKISHETAMSAASNPDDFALKLRGIEGTSDRSWIGGAPQADTDPANSMRRFGT
jgi:twitching motility protein PilT